ncbi:MAG: SEC-C domain-containing protein [Eggerthellaceae bacterium]|nr:SEC-C domain-containing protein [Eggerthellaceae bacterium]
MLYDTLSYAECEQFYALRDGLAVTAHKWLGADGRLQPHPDESELFDEALLRDTLDEVFAQPAIVERFVAENPLGLSADELAAVAAWKNVISGMFVVFEHASALLFMADGRLYHVAGLLEPVKAVLGGPFPKVVQTVLLPFAGRVVYYGFAASMPVQMGDGMRRMIDESITNALKSAEHVVDAADFIEVAPLVAEERVKREAERMIEDLEMDMKASQQLPGHHAGALVGMSAAEREAAVRARVREVMAESAPFDAAAHLKQGCTKGRLRSDLASLIATEKKATLQNWAQSLGLPYGGQLTKAQLADSLVPAIQAHDEVVSAGLEKMTPGEFASYRALYESAGVRHVPAEGLRSLKGLPPVMALMCYLFLEDGMFSFVIPDEVMRALHSVDWDYHERVVRDFRRSADVVDALTSLRGIVTFDDAYDEFIRCYPDAFDEAGFREGAFGAAEEGYAVYDIIDDGNQVYFAHYDLGNQFRSEHGVAQDPFPDPFLKGDLGSLRGLLNAQEGKHPRGLDEGMRASDELFEWRLKLPAVAALRDYLDAHVPDDADDYLFTDAVIEDLVEYMSYGMMDASAVRTYFEIMGDHGFMPDEAHMRRLLDLLMNMSNAMPTWSNNGWAPNELHGTLTGQKVFYNEDGSVRKVGRNEPCPCGSGKKYKRCCGR